MSENNCPTRFWDYAVKEASAIHNKTPKFANPGGLCPYEVVTGIRPDYSNSIPFYAAGMYHVPKEERKRLNYPLHSKSCHYLGRPDDSPKNFLLLDVRDRTIITRADVVFSHDHKFKEPREWHPGEKSYTIAAMAADYDDSKWSPTIGDFYAVQESDELYLMSMNGKEDELLDEVSFANVNCVPTDELTEIMINSMRCPKDFAEHWSSCWVAAVNGLSVPEAPKTVNEALDPGNPHAAIWWDAIVKELTNLDEAGTFGPAGPTGRGTKTKFVFRVSYDNDMKLKFKARLVFLGYSQIYGVDYKDTYAPTVPVVVVFIMFFISGHFKMYNSIFDVTAAFLEASNDYQQFCYLPAGLLGPNANYRREVLKALYGEKQAPKLWYDLLDKTLTEMGYERCPDCYCLYKRYDPISGDLMFTCIHVDDGFMSFNRPGMEIEFIAELNKRVRKATLVTDGLKKFLGMELEKLENHIRVHHSTYIKSIELFNIDENCRKADCPMSPSTNLKRATPNPDNEPLLPVTGKLRYPADRGRPDVLTALGKISSNGLPNPSNDHVESAKQIVRYLKQTHDLSMFFGGSSLKLFAFSDANWEKSGDCLSRLGFLIFLGYDSGAIHNESSNDTVVAHSSTESEIRAVDKCIRILFYVKALLGWMGLLITDPIPIYVDNQSLIDISEAMRNSTKTNHINVNINYIREMINNRTIELCKILTGFNVADMHTKCLSGLPFRSHRGKSMSGFGGDPANIHRHMDVYN